MTDEIDALIREAELDAKAFRENTVYDSDGDPVRLIANADRLDQYAAALRQLQAENAALKARVEALEGALTEAAILFRAYEQMHLVKGTQDGDEKAHRNHEAASKCEAALLKGEHHAE